jgi:hypothetical protein
MERGAQQGLPEVLEQARWRLMLLYTSMMGKH